MIPPSRVPLDLRVSAAVVDPIAARGLARRVGAAPTNGRGVCGLRAGGRVGRETGDSCHRTARATGSFSYLMLGGAVVFFLFGSVGWTWAGQVPSTAPVERRAERDVPGLIRKLGDSAYAVRVAATRELCRVGPAARKELEFAAESEIAETALRARKILKALDRVYFAGVAVSLSFSAERTPWDQPVDLVVTLVNKSDYPARLPFAYSDVGSDGDHPDAVQVGRMLDLADWLIVRDHKGQDVELRVDDFTADDDVRAAVERRLRAAPTSPLLPGEQVELRLGAFNRGWARYALLERGDYTVAFRYEPEWEDSVLTAESVGRVVAGPVTLTVLSSAPETVSRGGQEASVLLERAGDGFTVFVVNRYDRAQVVNRNLGQAAPFAQGNWIVQRDERTVELPAVDTPRALDRFLEDHLVSVAPGDRIELIRAPWEELRLRFAAAGAEVGALPWKLRFSYDNYTDRRWQDREVLQNDGGAGMPEALRTRLPANLLTGRYFSNEVTISNPKPEG